MIKFSSKIVTDCVREEGNHNICYNMVKWGKRGEFYILNDISDHVTLAQLIDTDGNVNHVVSILSGVGYMIPIKKEHFLKSNNSWILFVLYPKMRKECTMN